MDIRKKIKVLVVDDSLVFRGFIAKGIASDPRIEVVAVAGDPYMARDMIIKHEPDVMTLDIEMPKMNGIEFLKRLIPQHPIPVIVVSGGDQNVLDALDAGAVDFVLKPNTGDRSNMDLVINELIVKIKIASTAKVGHLKIQNPLKESISVGHKGGEDKIIAIGASTGGTEATHRILKELPKDMPGILVVQHMPIHFTRMYAERLNHSCLMEVKEAQDGDQIFAGRALIAPGEMHMRVKKKGHAYYVECFKGERVNGHCPSVDVLFQSVAENIGNNAIGVILTGMGYDGAKGLLTMKNKGAMTIGQDEASCVVYGMPKVAYDLGAVDKQLPIEAIGRYIYNLVRKQK